VLLTSPGHHLAHFDLQRCFVPMSWSRTLGRTQTVHEAGLLHLSNVPCMTAMQRLQFPFFCSRSNRAQLLAY